MTDHPLAGLVKKLVFEEGKPGVWLSGLVLGGEYRIKLTGGKGFQVSRGMLAVPDNLTWFPTLPEAQAAAQADYTARILAALDVEKIEALVAAAYEAGAEKVLAMQREVEATNERFAKARAPGVCVDYEAGDYAEAIRALTPADALVALDRLVEERVQAERERLMEWTNESRRIVLNCIDLHADEERYAMIWLDNFAAAIREAKP